MTVRLIHADCLEALATLEPDTVHAIVTDPPYGLSFMGQHWDHAVPGVEYWRACYRVLKPGAHCLAFAGTRTYHRMACAIEDAGFDIRDMVLWHYGSGFPKSHDVSKAIDRAAGVEIETRGHFQFTQADEAKTLGAFRTNEERSNPGARKQAPVTDAAKQWDGWGTALKPASEPICLARKPLSEKTIAANVLRWGTGALNIDGCRIPYAGMKDEAAAAAAAVGYSESMKRGSITRETSLPTTYDKPRFDPHANGGRWPANLCHDGSAEVLAAFPDSDGQQGDVRGTEPSECHNGIYSGPRKRDGIEYPSRNDSGSAARFFFYAKADAEDRLASKHPTVKPVALMQWLCRLITPPKGLILDPFAGTGTTGEAAWREGFRAILIEREERFVRDIERRIELMQCGPDERKHKITPQETAAALPLFGGDGSESTRGGAGRFTDTLQTKTNDWPDRTQVVNE